MAVSVRMNALLEKELEQAAQRKGITKSQFIIDAVESALGRKNPYDLLLAVKAQDSGHCVQERFRPYGEVAQAHTAAGTSGSLSEQFRKELQAQHQAAQSDWEAYQAAKRRGEQWEPSDEGVDA